MKDKDKTKKPFSFDAAFNLAKQFPGLGVTPMDAAFRAYVRSEMTDDDAQQMAAKEAKTIAMSGKGGNSEVIIGKDGAPRVLVSAFGNGYIPEKDRGLSPKDRRHRSQAVFIARRARETKDARVAQNAVNEVLRIEDQGVRDDVIAQIAPDIGDFDVFEALKPKEKAGDLILGLFALGAQAMAAFSFFDDNVKFV